MANAGKGIAGFERQVYYLEKRLHWLSIIVMECWNSLVLPKTESNKKYNNTFEMFD